MVLDISLPDGNGLGFLKELRRTSGLPVLLLTAWGTPNDSAYALKNAISRLRKKLDGSGYTISSLRSEEDLLEREPEKS